ncbi:MAG: hypothetical protein JW864_12565 [Spirochaetes bacterium]|nr:hypothetical protein [Spirochaetota bacterium]
MRKKVIISCLCVLLSFIPASDIFSGNTISEQESKDIIEKIRNISVKFYKENKGIEYLREELVREYDTDNDKLLSTSRLLVVRKDYFYEPQEYIVKKYEKDGKEMDASEYKEKPPLPSYPVFDEEGIDRYNTVIEGYETVAGKKCYKIKVTPKEADSRYQTGYYYYTVKDLSFYMIQISLGEMPFPLKSFSFMGIMNHESGFLGEYTMAMRIKIPIVVDRKITSEGKTIEANLIKK